MRVQHNYFDFYLCFGLFDMGFDNAFVFPHIKSICLLFSYGSRLIDILYMCISIPSSSYSVNAAVSNNCRVCLSLFLFVLLIFFFFSLCCPSLGLWSLCRRTETLLTDDDDDDNKSWSEMDLIKRTTCQVCLIILHPVALVISEPVNEIAAGG